MSKIVKVGDRVKIIANICGHKFEIGEEVEITRACNVSCDAKGKNGKSWVLSIKEFEIIEETTEEPTEEELIELAIQKGFVNGARIKSTMETEAIIDGKFNFCDEGCLYSNSGNYCIYYAQTKQWATVLEPAQKEHTEIEVLKSEIQHLKDLQKSMDKQHLELQDEFIKLQEEYLELNDKIIYRTLKSINFKHKAQYKTKKLKKKLTNTKTTIEQYVKRIEAMQINLEYYQCKVKISNE
jgi:hypothetical protein